jgi:hypothetical protein
MQLFDCFLRLKVSKLLKLYIMILSTTPTIEGHTIREYKGVVTHRSRLRDHRSQRFYANGSRQRHRCCIIIILRLCSSQGFAKAELK